MKIVIAPDKFKNSLTGLEFCNAVEMGIKEIMPQAEIIKLPLADGGDGTFEVVDFYLKGKIKMVEVSNPFFQPVKASYLYSESTKTAFIEMAEASGLKLLQPKQFDCKNATTFGTGEMIVDAMENGASKIILGIGGSATNDCGMGMAAALGYRFLDKNNKEVKPIGANLSQIVSIDTRKTHPKLQKITFEIACDVTNPLFGKNGAAQIYAPQKGATTKEVKMLDKGLRDFSKVVKSVFNVDTQSVEGAGAAGGMGLGAKVFLKGNLKPGIQLIKNLAGFDSKIENADWVITGEGKLDAQTLSGKTIAGVVASAKEINIPVAALCGSVSLSKEDANALGILYVDAVMSKAKSLEDAMQNGHAYVKEMAMDFAKKIT